jgi:hypothetical protein
MYKLAIIVMALALPISALAGPPLDVDLRAPHALENLKRDNPAHFETIRQILAGLEEKPERAEGDWLQANFKAQDVDLSRMLIKTSYPPKQLLSFRLDQMRYTLYVVRGDMVGQFQPLR